MSSLNVNAPLCDDLSGEAIIIVDTSNTSQLGEVSGKLKDFKYIYLIDHHVPGDIIDVASDFVVDKEATSNTQIIVLAIKNLGLKVEDRDLTTLALTGIIYDSRRFQLVDVNMLEATKTLMEWGGSYVRALELLSAPREEFSLRYAKIKAAQRMKIGRACKEILIVVTRIGSFESKVAKALIDFGADVAAVVGYHNDEIRVSIRVSNDALRRGVRASDIAEFIATKFGGKGGGHEAAGMTHIRLEKLTDEQIETIVERLIESLPGKVARLCTSRSRRSERT